MGLRSPSIAVLRCRSSRQILPFALAGCRCSDDSMHHVDLDAKIVFCWQCVTVLFSLEVPESCFNPTDVEAMTPTGNECFSSRSTQHNVHAQPHPFYAERRPLLNETRTMGQYLSKTAASEASVGESRRLLSDPVCTRLEPEFSCTD